MSTIEELLQRKNSGSGLENRDYGIGIRRADYATSLCPQKLALTSPTSGGRSVGIVRSRSKVTELLLLLSLLTNRSLKMLPRQQIHTQQELLQATFSMLPLSYERKVADMFFPEILNYQNV
jgi:hypothetical protein